MSERKCLEVKNSRIVANPASPIHGSRLNELHRFNIMRIPCDEIHDACQPACAFPELLKTHVSIRAVEIGRVNLV